MTAYILRRLLLMVPTLFGITLVCFTLIQFVPGGPVEQTIAKVRGMMNLPIEQDLHFRAPKRLSVYANEARMAGRIQA